ncbi:MAG TPA: MaoC family dehydratase [Actinomycetota bacterium]|nr:MaoC family dehydratase [Actinomycetota bacterium]
MFGPYFEDFEAGQVIRHSIGRTISEADNTWFTLLTVNTNQMHFNRTYAERSEFGRILVNSGFSVGLVVGMSVLETSHNAVANLGFEEIRFPNPLFVGDTVWIESHVLDVRPSRSRPHAGIVRVRTRGLNQDGKVCVTFVRSFMAYRRDAPEARDLFPEPESPIEEEGD